MSSVTEAVFGVNQDVVLLYMASECRADGMLYLTHLVLHLSLAGNSGRFTWVRLQEQQEQRYPFLIVCAVFSCVQTKVWLPTLGIFHVRTDVNACDCTQGMDGHCKRVCTES